MKSDMCIPLKGEELRKLINAPAYIECSSKTQEVNGWVNFFFYLNHWLTWHVC